MRKIFLFSILILHILLIQAQSKNSFVPGQLWLDDKGVHINAHGGGILIFNNKYYWFGEHKTEGEAGNNSNVGVHVYSSKNLTSWKDEGIALKMHDDTTSLLVKGSIVERPKVIYNKKTKKFVMWFHHELKGQGYKAALTGLAISDKVTGPYKYIKSVNPNAGRWPLNFPDEFKNINPTETMEGIKMQSPEGFKRVKDGIFVRRDFTKGQMARDMTLYVDDDGKAYHIHSSENNQTLHFAELTDDYQGFTGRYTRVLEGKANEAPAIFKQNGKYYMISSGTTGWKPNPARISVADEIMGPWKELGDPSRGSNDQIKTTFWSQSTFIVPVIGKKDAFIYMGDRWTPENAIDGRYIWLPIEFENNQPILRWHNQWDLSVFDKKKATNFLPGKIWLDNNGVAINAHGGNIIYHQNKYYWYGEHKMVGKSEAQFADSGIHCYSSNNLVNWNDEGMALTVSFADTTSDLAYGCILERPKVIYDQKQKLFIAYFKYYPRGTGYLKGYIGVATSTTPTGPFTYKHKFLGGSTEFGSGDFSMYEDRDKKVYHLTVRKPEKTFVIGALQQNKLFPEGKYEPVKGIALHTEAPALIFHDKKYFLIGSGSSGWKPNKARLFVADSLDGEFKDLGNPCIGVNPYNGIGADTTFGGQISYILKVEGKKNAYIAMFDIWKPNQPINGLYIWLPLVFKNGKPTITWKDNWNLDFFSSNDINSNDNKSTYNLVWSDEFNNEGLLDSTKWKFENGFVRNQEVQWYQNENAICKNGNLIITGKKEQKSNPNYIPGSTNWKTKRQFIEYTSSSVVMQKVHSFQYGKLEVRAKIDAQTGLWPAIWTVGVSGEWPSNGEVDIMEYYDNRILANYAHADKERFKAIWDGASISIDSLGGLQWANQFHLWSWEWDESNMRIFLDGVLLNEIDLNTTINKSDGKNPFRQPHYLILNLAMGGNRGGSLKETKLPSNYYIDYVRLYQKNIL